MITTHDIGIAGLAMLAAALGYFLRGAAEAADQIAHRYDDANDDGCPHCCIPAAEADRHLIRDVYAVGMRHGNRATLTGLYNDAQLGEFAEDWLEAVIAEGSLPRGFGRRIPDEPEDENDHLLAGMCKALAKA
jgi:hypothetical protein